MIERIVPAACRLVFVWSVTRCTPVYGLHTYEMAYIKNLKKVRRRGFRLEQVIMVDDTPAKLRKQYGNLPRINAFTGDTQDRELLALQRYLLDLKHCANIPAVEKRGWQSRYGVS